MRKINWHWIAYIVIINIIILDYTLAVNYNINIIDICS